MPKAKVIKKTIKDKNINDMFNNMLGVSETLNMNICYPKYLELSKYNQNITNVLEILSSSPLLKTAKMSNAVNELTCHILSAKNAQEETLSYRVDASVLNFNSVSDEEKVSFKKLYDKMKACDIIKAYIIMCDRLIVHKKFLSNKDNLSEVFLSKMAGVEFYPFPFATLNIKSLYDDLAYNSRIEEIRYLLMVLNKLLTLSHNLYKTYSKPDIDVDEFVHVILSNLDQVKKQIPRCDKAFKKIEESVSLLKDNFGTYYRDFTQTGNQTIIMENFVADVAKDTKADAQTSTQFRKIISHYRKLAKNQINDPKIKMLFDKVDENFKSISETDNLLSVKDLNEESSEEESTEEEVEEEVKDDPDAMYNKSIEEQVAFICGNDKNKK